MKAEIMADISRIPDGGVSNLIYLAQDISAVTKPSAMTCRALVGRMVQTLNGIGNETTLSPRGKYAFVFCGSFFENLFKPGDKPDLYGSLGITQGKGNLYLLALPVGSVAREKISASFVNLWNLYIESLKEDEMNRVNVPSNLDEALKNKKFADWALDEVGVNDKYTGSGLTPSGHPEYVVQNTKIGDFKHFLVVKLDP